MRGPALIFAAIIALLFFAHFSKGGDQLAAGIALVLAVIFSLSTSHLPGDADGQIED